MHVQLFRLSVKQITENFVIMFEILIWHQACVSRVMLCLQANNVGMWEFEEIALERVSI